MPVTDGVVPVSRAARELERKAAVAALLLADGYDRADIARTLGRDDGKARVSDGYVSKIVKHALERGMIERRFVLDRDALPDGLRDAAAASLVAGSVAAARSSTLRSRLTEAFPALRSVAVVDFANGDAGTGFERLARTLLDRLVAPDVVGVARGETLWNLAGALLELTAHDARPRWPDARVFPCTAEHVQRHQKVHRSTGIARALTEALTGRPGESVPSLRNFESLMPLSERQLHTIRADSEVYREIFGPPDPSATARGSAWHDALLGRADTLIASVSVEGEPIGGTLAGKVEELRERLREFGMEAEARELEMPADIPIVGDLAGSLVLDDREPLERHHLDWLKRYNHRVNGITHHHLGRLAAAAARQNAAINGIVVVASGSEKSAVVHALLRQGLVNRLFCDDRIAADLERALESAPPAAAPP